MRIGQPISEEVRQANLARDDLRSALRDILPDEAVAAAIDAIERLIDNKIATRKLY